MRHSVRLGLAVVLVLLVASAGAALAQGAGKVKLVGTLSPPQVTGPVTLAVNFYLVGRDNNGQYKLESTQNLSVYYDPRNPGRPARFEVSLDALKEYEVVVDVLDANGDPYKDGTYYFAAADMVGDYAEKRVQLRADQNNTVLLPLKWGPRNTNKGNFVTVVSGSAGYDLTLYFQPPAVAGI